MSLAEVLQFLCTEGGTGVLRLVHPVSGAAGEIHVLSGDPMDALSPGRQGLDAFNSLFCWAGGSFEFTLEPVERRDAIGKKMMAAVLDALRMVDEELIENDQQPEVVRSGTSGGPSPIRGPSFLDYMYIVDEEEYADGMTITEQGRYGNWVWVVLDGMVDVIKQTEHGQATVATYGRGAFIGGLSSVMRPEIPRHASYVARGEVHLGVIETQQLSTALSQLSLSFRAVILSLERRLAQIFTWRVDMPAGKAEALPERVKPLMKKGDKVSKGYLIQEGQAYVVHAGPGQSGVAMALGEEDFIGAVPFFEIGHEPLSFSVLASEDLRLAVMDVAALEAEYRDIPGLLRHIIEFTCISIASMTSQAGF